MQLLSVLDVQGSRVTNLHEAMEEYEGMGVDLGYGLGLARLPGLFALVLPLDFVQLHQLPALANHRAQGSPRPAVQGRLLEPAGRSAGNNQETCEICTVASWCLWVTRMARLHPSCCAERYSSELPS